MAYNQPNFYGNYQQQMPYQNYNPYANPYQIQTQQQIQQPQTYPSICGKIVENADMVRISEIPIGSYGVFPLSDSSKVFIKMYDKEGNIQTYCYDLVKDECQKNNDMFGDKLSEIYNYVARIDKKVDEIKSSSPISSNVKKRRMEVSEDE